MRQCEAKEMYVRHAQSKTEPCVHTQGLAGHTRARTNALSDQTGLASSGFSRGLWWDQARDAAVAASWVGREKGEGSTARDVCVCVCVFVSVCVCVHEVTGVYVAT